MLSIRPHTFESFYKAYPRNIEKFKKRIKYEWQKKVTDVLMNDTGTELKYVLEKKAAYITIKLLINKMLYF